MVKSRKIRIKQKVEILREVVRRNKLKDTPTESIDDMVRYLEKHNISARYVPKEEQ